MNLFIKLYGKILHLTYIKVNQPYLDFFSGLQSMPLLQIVQSYRMRLNLAIWLAYEMISSDWSKMHPNLSWVKKY